MLSTQSFRALEVGLASTDAAMDVERLSNYRPYGIHYYVSTFDITGNDTNSGRSSREPLKTMARALTLARTHDTIFFVGDVREEIVSSNLYFDIAIIGLGSLHHADLPSTTLYNPGASVWRPPASPTTATCLLELRARGWKFINIMFDCPVDAAAVKLVSNALSTTAEYNASHAQFINCWFRDGLYGIQDAGGCVNIRIENCTFSRMSPTGAKCIYNSSTAVRSPQYWQILGCNFLGPDSSAGNECHIDAPLLGSLIKGNVFGTVESTALYVDLTGGADNIVTGNVMAGDYAQTDYIAGTTDIWYGNWCKVTATQAPDGHSLVVPA